MAWTRDPHYQLVLDKQFGDDWKGVRPVAWKKGELKALVSRDDVGRDKPDLRWHISVSHASRVPNWDELVMAGHEIRPGVVFVIGLPPKSWWINVHPFVLHLYEVKDDALVAQWRSERMGMQPT